LFFGLRRGGNTYYALNVTNPSQPSLAWQIKSEGVFSQLGETWSKLTLAKLRYKKDGSTLFDNVLVFGGGYDNRLDDEGLALSNNMPSNIKGNGVYIVNAKTGDLIWSYSGGDLKHSVPSSIRVLDIDRNGSIDRLYFGDTGGNIWRADLNIDDTDDDASLHDVTQDARIHKFAQLGGNGANARKFFYEPDIAVFNHSGKSRLIISIGSGYRSHPSNSAIKDRFYVLNDENFFEAPSQTPSPLTEYHLVDSGSLNGEAFLPSRKGWFMRLSNGTGEKALASPLIFNNKVMFTTFTKVSPVPSTNACLSAVDNQTRAYVLDLLTASATADIDGDGNINSNDESVAISSNEILGTPQLVFNKPSNCTKEGCDHFVDVRVGDLSTALIDKNTKNGGTNLGEQLPKVYWISP